MAYLSTVIYFILTECSMYLLRCSRRSYIPLEISMSPPQFTSSAVSAMNITGMNMEECLYSVSK